MWKKWLGKSTGKLEEAEASDIDPARLPKHIAVIMDGNGRWAQAKGMPRTFGHRAGVEALRDVVKCASELGIQALTAYAFSTENWRRPAEEVNFLMRLFSRYLDSEIEELHKNQVQIRFIGMIEDLSENLRIKIEQAQAKTASNQGLVLTLAVNYGGRAEIVRAVQGIACSVRDGDIQPQDITEALVGQHLYNSDLPDPDLLIRPSGDLRISNFLLWQIAYAEFWFTPIYWPDFKPDHLLEAVREFQRRERRFGGLKK